MNVTQSIICDLTARSLKTVEVAHNDSGSRKVKCLLRADGEPWEVPEGVTAAVGYTLPGGGEGLYDTMPDGSAAAEIDGSTVTVQLSDAILSASGAVTVAVELRKDGAKLHTFPFRVNVIGANRLSNAETFPALGAGFAGKLLYGGAGGSVTPLELGTGLAVQDGALTASGGGGAGVTDDGEGNVVLSGIQDDGNGNIAL